MASIVSAGTTSATALNMSADTSGVLSLASNNGVVALTIDTSQNIGVNSASSTVRTKLMVSSSNASDTVTVGTVSGGFSVTNTNTAYGLQFGSLSTGNSWIQSARMDGTATAYNLLLQPGGGNVGVGTTSPANLLTVSKDVSGAIGPVLALNNAGGGTSTASGLYFTNSSFTQPNLVQIYSSDDNSFSANLIFAIKTPGADGNGTTTRMQLNSAGGLSMLGGSVYDGKISVNGGPGNPAASASGFSFVGSGSYGGGLLLVDGSANWGYYNTATTLNWAYGTSGGALSIKMTLTNGGAFSATSKSFNIPHPLPALSETHRLVHMSVESPQADLIYRGVVNLVNGTATVNIDTESGMTDGTFVALNKSVQCFTTNETDWDAVKGEVIGNQLTVSCNNPQSTAKISWMVIGQRQDPAYLAMTETVDSNGNAIVEPLNPVGA